MKRIVNSLLVILLSVTTFAVYGGTENQSEELTLNSAQFQAGFIETALDDRMVVALKNPYNEPLELEIIDDDGKAIYSEEIGSHEEFIRRYDFSELEDGHYHVKVSGTSGHKSEFILLR